MMTELRDVWHVLDANGIIVRARHIRGAANVWKNRLGTHLDNDDWQLDPVLFTELGSKYGLHCIDRFASALNKLLPVTPQEGSIPPARPWSLYTFQTTNVHARTNGATPSGP
jgi:hypothetical protein